VATVTLLASLVAEAWQIESVAFAQRSSGSLSGVPKLECVVDKLAILTHWADHRMIAHKCHYFLFGGLMLDERSNGPEAIGPVAGDNVARLFDRQSRMLVS
jgi:hypothetical protein